MSTVHGALVSETKEGLDVEELFADWLTYRERGRSDDAFKKFLESPPTGARIIDKNEILLQSAEIFIPAARTDVLGMPEEAIGRPGMMDVTRFVDATGVRVVVQGANHPVTNEAEEYLEKHGVFILPDYLINCGGLIGCWADWVYRRELQGSDGEEWYHRLNESAPRYISKIVGENIPRVLEITENQPKGMRKATEDLAHQRRKELTERFLQVFGDDSDGRKFARFCMDDLLS